MATPENLQKLKGILAKMADLIREAEGHSDPISVADMRQKIAAMDIATFTINTDVLSGHTVVSGSADALANPNIKFLCNSVEGWSPALEAELNRLIA